MNNTIWGHSAKITKNGTNHTQVYANHFKQLQTK